MFKLSIKNISLFALIWLNIGFALGFTVLIGPVRWIATYSRQRNYSDSHEALLIKGVMLVLAAVSFIISMRLSAAVLKAKFRSVKIIIPVACLTVGILALYQLLHPENLKMFSSQLKDSDNRQFVFGSYPGLKELESLKKEGCSSVISLLHPAVTPFEPVLLKEEEENCKKVGLTLISIPMLPWISENQDALNKIRHLAEHPTGRYYVHCYLGKDRVNLVKRLISNYNNSVRLDDKENKGRTLESISKFERGEILKINKDVYYTPYPTDEEYSSYLIAGGVQQVISLMDPTDQEQKSRIEDEKKLVQTYQMPFQNIPISSIKNKKELDLLKEIIAKSPKPLVIHRFFSSTAEDIEIFEALRK
ncbi:hypothetical protein [Segetibacter aerophilus]|uniref:Uncharacterized protein n=1 Tax=Segetibacter aerophilus TaxID=670293 RepID=A0A512BFT3_9BACT|nr:hypothetical protein [Segetibacter aerophilus]GEO10828.1 hypothetical protein SAE01_33240 [Segetibacter aerophilus]